MAENGKRRSPAVTGGKAMDISILIERVLDKNHITEDMNFKVISERFSEVVGASILPHVKVEKIEQRTLVLKASSSTWKSELFLQKNAIIDKCNSLLGKPFLRSIRFV